MREDLKAYFEKELRHLAVLGREFADQNPGAGGRLQMQEDGSSADPHVQRLSESFAFLAARIHLKLDDGFPQITEALLQVLYPHFLAPVPSMAIAQLTLDPAQGKVESGYHLAAGARLSWHALGTPVTFRTAYPVTLWPIRVQSVAVERRSVRDRRGRTAAAALVLRLSTTDGSRFEELELSTLRFHLTGQAAGAATALHEAYERLLGGCSSVQVRSPGGAPELTLPGKAVTAVGFAKDEGLLPYSSRSHLGYRLIQEYFSFPAKFLFFDVGGLDGLSGRTVGSEIELVFVLDRPLDAAQVLTAENIRLGCTPIVNLFSYTAPAIDLDYARTEYEITPEPGRTSSTEVYSIDRVVGLASGEPEREYHPFYSVRHTFGETAPTAFWHALRRQSSRGTGTDVFLTLVDRNFSPTTADRQQLLVDVTCTNRDWPGRNEVPMPAGMRVEGGGPVAEISCLNKPTRAMWPRTGHDTQWQLISHLSLNYLSLVEADEHGAPEALRAILSLYDVSGSRAVQAQIQALSRILGEGVTRFISPQGIRGFARGVRTTIELDEALLAGADAGTFLFSSVLEKFLALCVSVNSFSELVARNTRGDVLWEWPPRSGFQALL